MTKTKLTKPSRDIARKGIVFHAGLDLDFEGWAKSCGYTAQTLRARSRKVIRTRHHEAWIDHPADRGTRHQPTVYTLDLKADKSVTVHYTVEGDRVVIRGYGIELGREPLDDFEAGGYFTEASWDGDFWSRAAGNA